MSGQHAKRARAKTIAVRVVSLTLAVLLIGGVLLSSLLSQY